MNDNPAQNQNQDQIDTQSDQTQDASQKTQPPSSPESPPVTSIGQQEQVQSITSSPEVQKPIETEPKPEIQKPETQPKPAPKQNSEKPENAPAPKKQIDEEPEHVVDLRTGQKELKRVNEDADKLTTIADLEEQEFIEEVEKHHGNR